MPQEQREHLLPRSLERLDGLVRCARKVACAFDLLVGALHADVFLDDVRNGGKNRAGIELVAFLSLLLTRFRQGRDGDDVAVHAPLSKAAAKLEGSAALS